MKDEKKEVLKVSDADKIKTLITLGISQENITKMLNEGLTLEAIEDFCNNKINDVLEESMKDVLNIIAQGMKDYKFFALTDEDIERNKKINNNIFGNITQKLLEKDILFKNINVVFKTVVDRTYVIVTNAEDNYKQSKEALLAELLGRELPIDIKLMDIDKKRKEVSHKIKKKSKK